MATWAEEIVGEIELGDKRLDDRLAALVEALAERPEASIPEACGDWAGTMAAYRFFKNDSVDPQRIIEGMAQATAARCQSQPRVLVVQDTTSLDYTTHRDTTGLGPLEDSRRRGLFMHTALAVSEEGVPQGLIDLQIWGRDPNTIGKRHQRHELPIEAKESAKWLRAVRQAEVRLGPQVRVLTVADREADVYELFALAHELDGDWLIRARHDRALKEPEGKLLAAVEGTEPKVCTRLELPARDGQPAREARLEIRSTSVVLVPPRRSKAAEGKWWAAHPEAERLAPTVLRAIRVGVVLVTEVDPPAGVKPVRWLLLTSLPVDSPQQALACVLAYRLRWLVERYHFVLKSGCQVEKLQLETAERLHLALVVYAGVAWRLLWLTYQARVHADAPCTVVFDDDTWQALYATHHQTLLLPEDPPDLRTAVGMVARLGGFLGRSHDGEPGVKTIWRGLRRLDDIVATWRLLNTRDPASISSALNEVMTCV